MRWCSPRILVLSGIVVVMLIGIPTFLVRNAIRSSTPASPTAISGLTSQANAPTPTSVAPQRIQVAMQTVIPVEVTVIPTTTNTQLFANPSEPAYVPGKGFSPDAQRVIDLATLQTGLEKYRVAKGRYPPTLATLFPDFAPVANGQLLTAPPADPLTHNAYDYQVSADGMTYQLRAVLSAGKPYSVSNP